MGAEKDIQQIDFSFKEEKTPPELVDRVVNAIIGENAKPEDKQQVKDNIVSIREAIQGGKHDTLFYPASGSDILRPLFAYDASYLVAVDLMMEFDQMQEEITKLGIEKTIKNSSDKKRREITFELEGKKREVVLFNEDARLINLTDFGLDKVDVLHQYLPLEARDEMTELDLFLIKKYGFEGHNGDKVNLYEKAKKDPNCPKTIGEEEREDLFGNKWKNELYKILHPGFSHFNMYKIISEKGFLIYNESSYLMENFKKYGFKEMEIRGRNPKTVDTISFNEEKAKIGYIYQKIKEADYDKLDKTE